MQEQFAIQDLAALGNNADVEFLLQDLTPQDILFELQRASVVMPNIVSKQEMLKLYAGRVRDGVSPYDHDAYEEMRKQRKLQRATIDKSRVAKIDDK